MDGEMELEPHNGQFGSVERRLKILKIRYNSAQGERRALEVIENKGRRE
jgi:hypothetical protein